MKSAQQLSQTLGINKSLRYCGVSKTAWYYTKHPRDVMTDPEVTEQVQRIAQKRRTYGTRRMAAQVSRDLKRPVNRKKIKRIYKKLGWTEPSKTKSHIIRSNKKLLKPTAPNQLWEADMSYVWCGIDGWCYCFNVLDVFTRKWLGFAFDTRAVRHNAIMSVNNAVASHKPDCSKLTVRVDNGPQYTSHDFRDSVAILGANLEHIYVNTPQQNGHIESFHKTLKKEYVWPHEFASYQEAEVALLDAFADYNAERIHSSLGYLTPNEFAESWEMRNK